MKAGVVPVLPWDVPRLRIGDVQQMHLRSFAVDDRRNNVSAYAVFRGTHTGDGGPIPPTGKRVEADYVYVMEFDGDRIRHMTKIWNDGISLKQLGWM